jgi:hypothetical protein
MSNDDFQGLVDNANRMNPHHHRHHGVELLMAGLVSGLVAGAVQNRQQARAKAEYEARARYQARFEVPNVYRPIDLATGLYHPQHAGNRQEAYDDLLVGHGVAEECDGIAIHDTWGPCSYGGIWGMLRELEHDAEVDRARGSF